MININLLPEVMRKKDGAPRPQFLVLMLGLLILGLLGYVIFMYDGKIKALRGRIQSLERSKRELEAQAQELKDIRAEITRLKEYVDTVKSLYRKRIIWARILADVKEIINYDPTMNEYNTDMRYLWLTSLKGGVGALNLNGFATASNPVMAMQMPEQLLQGFQTYAPREMPEKGEESRLNTELQQAIAENEALRRENPDLPLQSSREIALRERLAEIREISSGGLALQPFSSFVVPGSLRLVQATWAGAPQPRTSNRSGEQIPELFPSQAWSFNIAMELKQ